MMWLGIISVVTLAAGGFTLHKQHLETKAQLAASELRIAELERALSATGEEMGESAGAIRAKLTAVSERTDELWTQMDKLWASAWRRNQSEIKSLKEQTTKIASSQTKASKDASTKINSLSQTQTEQALKLSFLEEQQQAANAIKDQLATLTTSLDQLKAQSKNRDNKQVEIGASLAQLEMTQSALAEQLERLSNRLSTASSAQQTSKIN